MIVCLCANVTERELVATVEAGASTVKEVGRPCGAGTGCGARKPLIRECLSRCRQAAPVPESAAGIVAGTIVPEPASA